MDNNLKAIRQGLGLTQKDIEERSRGEMSQVRVSLVERGLSPVRKMEVVALTYILQTPAEQIFPGMEVK
jgi:transcriptional regulator with XRE-family HTH domain